MPKKGNISGVVIDLFKTDAIRLTAQMSLVEKTDRTKMTTKGRSKRTKMK